MRGAVGGWLAGWLGGWVGGLLGRGAAVALPAACAAAPRSPPAPSPAPSALPPAGAKYSVKAVRRGPQALRLHLGATSVDVVVRKLNDGGLLVQVRRGSGALAAS